MSEEKFPEACEIHLETALSSQCDQQELKTAINASQSVQQMAVVDQQRNQDQLRGAENIQPECFRKLVSFYKENCSIPRFTMFPCNDCSEHFVDSISRQVHMMQKHANLLSSCELCHKIFATNSEKMRHIKLTHSRVIHTSINDGEYIQKFTCKMCYKVEFDSFEELVSHTPCLQIAPRKAPESVKRKLSRYRADATKSGKRGQKDMVLVLESEQNFAFDFLNDCDQTNSSYPDDPGQFCDNKEVIMSDDRVSLTSSELESVEANIVDASSDLKQDEDEGRNVCNILQVDNDGNFSSVLQINNNTSNLLPNTNNSAYVSSGVLQYSEEYDGSECASDERRSLPVYSESDVQISDCEHSEEIEMYGTGGSYHFTEGGESWTISENVDHEDADSYADPLLAGEREYAMLTCDSETSQSCLFNSEMSTTNMDTCTVGLADGLPTDMCAFPDDGLPANTTALSSDGLHADPTDLSVDEFDTGTDELSAVSLTPLAMHGLPPDTGALVDDSEPDSESCSLCSQTFYNCLQLKQHISLYHMHKATIGGDIVETASEVPLEAGKDTQEMTEEAKSAVSGSCEMYQIHKTEPEADIAEAEAIAKCPLEAEDNSQEICDQCPAMFESLSGMKDHVKYSHTATTEPIASIPVTAGVCPTALQVPLKCEFSYDTDPSDVCVENRGFQVKTESVCDSETDCKKTDELSDVTDCIIKYDTTSGSHQLNNETIDQRMEDYTVTGLHNQSGNETKTKRCNDEKSPVPNGPSKKRKCVKRKAKELNDPSWEPKNALSKDEGTGKVKVGRRKRIRQCTANKSCTSTSSKQISREMPSEGNSYELITQTNEVIVTPNSFKKPSEYQLHCSQCRDVFQSVFQKQIHMEECHGVAPVVPVTIVKLNRPFGCSLCQQIFEDQTTLILHKLVTHSKNYYPCDLCDKVFAYPGLRRKHMALVHFMSSIMNGVTQAAQTTVSGADVSGTQEVQMSSSTVCRSSNKSTEAVVSSNVAHRVEVTAPTQTEGVSSSSVCRPSNTMTEVAYLSSSDVHRSNDKLTEVAVASPGAAQGLNTMVDQDGSNSDFSEEASLNDKVFVPTTFVSSEDVSSKRVPVSADTSVSNAVSTDDLSADAANVSLGLQGFQLSDRELVKRFPRNAHSSNISKTIASSGSSARSSRKKPVKTSVNPSRSMLPCKFCEEEFDSVKKLAQHAISKHQRSKTPSASVVVFPCKFCGKELSTLKQLISHATRAHSEEMPLARYPCECGKSFTTTSSLALHLRDSCKVNMESRPKSEELSKSVDAQNRLNNSQCKFCDHWFQSLKHLQKHAKKSHPSRPIDVGYPCHCGERFSSVKELYFHKMNHEDEQKRVEQEVFTSVLRSVFKKKQNEHTTEQSVLKSMSKGKQGHKVAENFDD